MVKIAPELAKQIWIPILIRLRQERNNYHYRAALEMSRGIRRGYTAQDMLEELQFVLKFLEKDGLVQFIKQPPQQITYFGISFQNSQFYFTEQFDREVKTATESNERQFKRRGTWEKWLRPFLVSLVGGAIGGVCTWLIIERLIK